MLCPLSYKGETICASPEPESNRRPVAYKATALSI